MTRKYWMYYLLHDDEVELYAYTDIKSYAKEFEIERNMNKFKCVKKLLTRSEINYLAMEHQNSYLQKVQMDIYDKGNNEWVDGSLIMTGNENLTVANIAIKIMNDELYRYCNYSPEIFKKKIFKALEIFEYNNVYRQLTTTIYNMYDDDSEINVKADTLGIFLHYYGKTMRGI